MATAAPAAKVDLGRVISRGVDAFGRNLIAFAGLALLLGGVPVLAADYLLGGVFSNADYDGPFWTYGAASFVVDFVLGSLLSAILVRSSILTLNGEEGDVGGSVLAALRLLAPLVAVAVLTVLVVIVGLILLIVPGIIFYVGLTVAVPVFLVERRGIVQSLHRSAELTAGNRGRIFLLLLLYWVIWFALAAAIELAFGAGGAGGVGGGTAGEGGGGLAVGPAIAQALATAAASLIAAVMVASLYVELRTVKEGATRESLAAIFE